MRSVNKVWVAVSAKVKSLLEPSAIIHKEHFHNHNF